MHKFQIKIISNKTKIKLNFGFKWLKSIKIQEKLAVQVNALMNVKKFYHKNLKYCLKIKMNLI